MMDVLNTHARAMRQSSIRQLFEKANAMADVIHLELGEPDMDTHPDICAAAKRALDEGRTHYTPNAGIMPLREALAKCPFANGLAYDPATEVMVTVGAINALALALFVSVEPGDGVLVQDPEWLNYFELIRFTGGEPQRVCTVPEEDFACTAARVRQALAGSSKVLMLNSPSNPSGQLLGRRDAEQIAELAIERDLLVISDEVYSTLVYDGGTPVSIATLPGMRERTLVINAFSKSFAMTGWRIGCAFGPARLVGKMTQLQEYLNACAATACQYGALHAVRHMEIAYDLRAIFERRRDVMLAELARVPGFRCYKPGGAFYLFADTRAFGMPSAQLSEDILEKAGVAVSPGSAFGEMGEGFLRLSYANSEENLRAACGRLRAYVRTHHPHLA